MWIIILELFAFIYFPSVLGAIGRFARYLLVLLLSCFLGSIAFAYVVSKVFSTSDDAVQTHVAAFPTFILTTVKGWQHVGCQTQEALDLYERHELHYRADKCEKMIASGVCKRLSANTGVFVLQSHFGTIRIEEVNTRRMYWTKKEAVRG